MSTNGNSNGLPENERPKEDQVDLAAEFAALGKKFAEAMGTAWNSEERHKIQREMASGLQRLADEANSAAQKARETEMGQKVESGVKQVSEDLRTGKVADDFRSGLVTALRGLGEAIDKVTDNLNPAEKEDTPKE